MTTHPTTTTTTSEPLVDVRDVTFQYPNAPAPALRDVNVQLNGGDRVLVIGHNGSGKSTLFSLLAGRRKPRAPGTVRVLGADPFDDTSMVSHITLVGSPWPAEAVFAVTVDKLTSPAPVPERKAMVADALHLRLTRRVDHMSSGEKRRVQILHGMLAPASVYLLDECGTDVDVAERRTLLELVRREVVERNGCALYATHIFDRVDGWATHVLLLKGGQVVALWSMAEVEERMRAPANLALEELARQFMSPDGITNTPAGAGSYTVFDARAACAGDGGAMDTYLSAGALAEGPEPVITCAHLSYRDIFRDMSFTLYRGERVLLCGCNGAGKSTLLNMLGGRQYFNNSARALVVLDRACYADMGLNGLVAYGGDWWASVPGGEVHVREMLAITTSRARKLRELLAVDLDWDVRHISSGERKRVQLLLHLLEDRPIVLLDEATADLDVDQRHALLSFLFTESVVRGVTVVYATHIFGGLEGWASAVLVLDRMAGGVHALWRAQDGESMHLDRVVSELVALKEKEVF